MPDVGQEDLHGIGPGTGAYAHATHADSILQFRDAKGSVIVHVGGSRRDAEVAVEVPWQVPAPSASFVDREELLAWLDAQHAALRADPAQVPRIAVVAGPSGIGKEAAVRRWVYRSSGDFPGGVLYLDCDDYGATEGVGTVDVSAMLEAGLRALGVPAEAVLGSPARAGQFQSKTSGTALLVVIVHATHPAQVRYLVPRAPGSLVLVTSASSEIGELRDDGASIYRVGGLGEAAARELFAAVCGPERAASEPRIVADLVRWCAGQPNALLILAGRIADTPSLTLAEVAAELADETRRLGSLRRNGKEVAVALTTAYRRLAPDARLLYRRLGLLPGTVFNVEVAAVAAGIGAADTRRLLDELVAAYLLEARGGGRFGFGDLVRLHAREMAEREEPGERREAVVYAVVQYYLVRTAYADRAVMGADRARAADHAADHRALLDGHPNPFDDPDLKARKAAAMAWLDAERANFIPLVDAAVGHGWDDEAWQLAEALLAYYYNRRPLADWVTAANAGMGAAHRRGNVEAEARLRLAASRAQADLGELARVREHLDAAGRLADDSGNPALQGSVWEMRGRYLEVADPSQALAAYKRAHDLNADAGEWRGVGLALYFGGAALAAVGRYAEALDTLLRARDLLRWREDDRMANRTLIAIGAAQAALNQIVDAAATLGAAAEELEGSYYEAQARVLLADLAEQAGDHDAAQRHLRRALTVYSDVGHPQAAEIAARLDE